MTEVRKSLSGNLGLFTSKEYQGGDILLEETPIIVLSQLSTDSKSKPSGIIKPPSSLDSQFHGTFISMVKTGQSWMRQKSKDEKVILDLYFPTSDFPSPQEKTVLEIAKAAVEYIKKSESGYQEWEALEKAMLIWACNAFQGGRIYPTISRVNHDCNPNAVIKADGETLRLIAAVKIAAGEEIKISYLGSMLYADKATRNNKLQRTKYFECTCNRCSSEDTAARIPCPSCHPRQAQQSLDEDVQYDDDQTVQYTIPTEPCSKCKLKLVKSSKLSKSMAAVTEKVVSYLETQEASTDANRKGEDYTDNEILEEHISLASTIMGAKHWTTNMLMLLYLERRLSSMSTAIITKQQMPEMEDIAESIDSLQRVQRFVESSQLQLHMGHLLGDVIIGISRTLVSLGDVKSQKYGAEWLEKIKEYVDKFESEGRQKVVSALSMAWERHTQDGSYDSKHAMKKIKTKR
jgi:hypothetical protein